MAWLEIMAHVRSREMHPIHVAKKIIRQTECSTGGIDSVRLYFTLGGSDVQEIVGPSQILVAEFEAVVSLEPAHVIDEVPPLGNLVLRPPSRPSHSLKAILFHTRHTR